MNFLSQIKDLYCTTQPKPWSLEKPIIIQFPVNDICNSKCQMCNIWQQKLDSQVTPSELGELLHNSLFSEVRGVGINGGEPTLRKDLPEIVDTLFLKLPKLTTISLITNALKSEMVIERIREIGKVVQKHNGQFDVMVSLDGVGDLHDQVRGRRGNFANAIKVIDFIQSSALVKNRRLGCTVIRENVYGIHELLEFALSKNIYIKYRVGIPHQRLYSKDVVDPFALSFPEKCHLAIFLQNLIQFYETSEEQIFFYKSLIGQIIYDKPRTAGCDWQHRGITLSSHGEILYCAVESKVLGSALKQDAELLYKDNSAHLKEIVQTKCDFCMHDYMGLPPTSVFLKSKVIKGIKKIGLPLKELKDTLPLRTIRSLKRRITFTKRAHSLGIKYKDANVLTPALHFRLQKESRRKVLICGWYGTETLGDKAILGGIVLSLHRIWGDVELHLVALETYISQMTVQQMQELQGCQVHSQKDALNIVDTMDLVMFGGGPLMAIDPLLDMLAIFHKAAKANVPTIIAGCGVGPLGANYYNNTVKQILDCASIRIFRDTKSLQIAHSLGIDTSKDYVAEDPALTWLESVASIQLHNEHQLKSAHPKLLLGLRDWPYHEYAPSMSSRQAENVKSQFEAELIAALKDLVKQCPNLEIIPFPMCTNHIGGDDRWFYRRLFRDCGDLVDALNTSYLNAELSPADSVTVFKSASAALTMRFHSLIFAVATNLPALSIDYTLGQGKVSSLAHKYQIPNISLDAVRKDSLVEMLLRQLSTPLPHLYKSNNSELLFQESLYKSIIELEND